MAAVLEVEGLQITYTAASGAARAVDGVSFSIEAGEYLGLVGESGCGKSTLGRLAVGLLPMSAGERHWKGLPVDTLPAAQRREVQLRMQMIFQDPYASLNPRMRVVDIVGEAPVAHRLITSRQKTEYVGLQLNRVGLDHVLLLRLNRSIGAAQCFTHARGRQLARDFGIRQQQVLVGRRLVIAVVRCAQDELVGRRERSAHARL